MRRCSGGAVGGARLPRAPRRGDEHWRAAPTGAASTAARARCGGRGETPSPWYGLRMTWPACGNLLASFKGSKGVFKDARGSSKDDQRGPRRRRLEACGTRPRRSPSTPSPTGRSSIQTRRSKRSFRRKCGSSVGVSRKNLPLRSRAHRETGSNGRAARVPRDGTWPPRPRSSWAPRAGADGRSHGGDRRWSPFAVAAAAAGARGRGGTTERN